MNRDYYGPHLMVDVRSADRTRLADLSRVSQFLGTLPDLIGMNRLTPPITFPYYPENNPSDPEAGITGVVVIAESHISLHTYPNQGRAYFDAFSCRPFDQEAVLAQLVDTFGVLDYDLHTVRRGALPPVQRGPLGLVVGS